MIISSESSLDDVGDDKTISFGYVTKSVVSLVKSKRTELTGLFDLLALGSSA